MRVVSVGAAIFGFFVAALYPGLAESLPMMADGSVHTVNIQYQPGTLYVFIDDLANPEVVASVDPATAAALNAGAAWIGFTSGLGTGDADVDILNWSFSNGDSDYSFTDFTSVAGISLVGNASQSLNRLRLVSQVDGFSSTNTYQTAAAWTTAQHLVGDGFSTTFDFQITTPNLVDGLSFVIQGAGTTVLGGCGFGLGYLLGDNAFGRCNYGNLGSIPGALAVEFDTFANTAGFGNPSWPPEYIADGQLLGGAGTDSNHVAVVSTVPEPSTVVLMGLGLFILSARSRYANK